MHSHFVGMDVHKQVIAFCIKTADGSIVAEGKVKSTQPELDAWLKTVPSRGWAAWRRRCSATGSITT